VIALLAMLSTASAGTQTWSEATAHTLPKGHFEVGIFAPLRWGLKESVELEIHPLIAIKSPHLAVKKGLGEAAGFDLGLRSALAWPTPGYRFLARPGIGGLLPVDADIPNIFSLDERLLATRELSERSRLTLELRAQVGVATDDSEWPTIDAPLLFSRSHAHHGGVSTAMGALLEQGVSDAFTLVLDLDAWLLIGTEENWSTEARLMARWQPGERFRAELGGEFVAGAYPYGNNWHVLPGFDLIWSF
jgi:hypothetical protein